MSELYFGRGHYVGPVMSLGDVFFELPMREQALQLGEANGCPVVRELITDRGAETMRDRYGTVNYWFGHITRMVAEAGNGELYAVLTAHVDRKQGEPVGDYERESVPAGYTRRMAPMGTLPGYSLPRLFVAQLEAGEATKAARQARMDRGLTVVEAAAPFAETPAQFLAMVAKGIAEVGDLTEVQVLQLTLSQVWLGEHNAVNMLESVKHAFAVHAPELWARYSAMTPGQRAELKLA